MSSCLYCEMPPERGEAEMTTIVKFEFGEYVPLAEYQALEELFRHSARQYTQADDERGKLEALIQRVVEIGPFLHADSIADVIYGKNANAERLSQLLKDCQESPKGRRSALD